jgi:hypothetical protein
MLREHGVPLEAGEEVKVAVKVLRVVGEVLADDFAVGVGEELVEGEGDYGFLFERPVTVRTFRAHDWDAESLRCRPCEADAGGVPCAGFNVHGELAGTFTDLLVELMKNGQNG